MTPQGPAKGLSIFFPAYNDSGTIASLVITALRTARTLTPDHEVIVVNDGSADGTAEILEELASIYPQVRIVTHEKHRG
jgi:glycosyltransferase involved in cell wall biosynthesis